MVIPQHLGSVTTTAAQDGAQAIEFVKQAEEKAKSFSVGHMRGVAKPPLQSYIHVWAVGSQSSSGGDPSWGYIGEGWADRFREDLEKLGPDKVKELIGSKFHYVNNKFWDNKGGPFRLPCNMLERMFFGRMQGRDSKTKALQTNFVALQEVRTHSLGEYMANLQWNEIGDVFRAIVKLIQWREHGIVLYPRKENAQYRPFPEVLTCPHYDTREGRKRSIAASIASKIVLTKYLSNRYSKWEPHWDGENASLFNPSGEHVRGVWAHKRGVIQVREPEGTVPSQTVFIQAMNTVVSSYLRFVTTLMSDNLKRTRWNSLAVLQQALQITKTVGSTIPNGMLSTTQDIFITVNGTPKTGFTSNEVMLEAASRLSPTPFIDSFGAMTEDGTIVDIHPVRDMKREFAVWGEQLEKNAMSVAVRLAQLFRLTAQDLIRMNTARWVEAIQSNNPFVSMNLDAENNVVLNIDSDGSRESVKYQTLVEEARTVTVKTPNPDGTITISEAKLNYSPAGEAPSTQDVLDAAAMKARYERSLVTNENVLVSPQELMDLGIDPEDVRELMEEAGLDTGAMPPAGGSKTKKLLLYAAIGAAGIAALTATDAI